MAAYMIAFVGESEHNLDDKGRLIIPQRHREALAGGHFLTKGLDHCLWVLPLATFQRIDAQMFEASILDENTRDLERMFYAGVDGHLDSQGRLTVPPALRRYAGLDDEATVVVVGTRMRLELWSRERWAARSEHLHEHGAAIAQQLKGLV
jgi:MraZ protein